MAGKDLYDWPDDDELVKLVISQGSQGRAARWIGCSRGALEHRLHSRDLAGRVSEAKRPRPMKGLEEPDPVGVKVEGHTAVITEPPTSRPRLGDIGQLIKERGLDPTEWVVASTTLNEWDGPVAGGGIQRLRQWKVTLRRAPHLLLALPAVHVPKVKRTKVGPPASEKPETIVVEGDHQVPYQDPRLHEASVSALRDLSRRHRLAEHVYLGDTGDYPSISRFDDNPSATASVNEVTQGVYELIREKVDAAPGARCRKLKGNHDWRLEGELLKRAERMYGIRPAETAAGPELPALSLRRLLHLDQLGVELVEDPRGWQHAEVELVAGAKGLVVRHGWLTGAKTAEKSLRKRGRSIIVGHIHTREHAYLWDPSAECERQGVVLGTMSLTRSRTYPHYTTLEGWLQGFGIVTRWPDGRFLVEHASWDGKTLTWRDNCWRG